MTIAQIRIGLLFILCSALVGCGSPLFKLPLPEEQKLFVLGMDQYEHTGETRILETLPRQYPDGEWTRRAEDVLRLVEEQRQQAAAIARDKEKLNACRQEKAYLASDNKMLEATLEQLKQLLINMEMRAE